jgi:hypothetical protein
MRRFRYWSDPLFLLGCGAYALNRWLIKPHVTGGFVHSHFNDLWLVPCALPPILWLHRRLQLRSHDDPPSAAEIATHLVFWSLLFEWLGPNFVAHTTGDPADVLAYVIGAIVAGAWWHREHRLGFFSRV